MADLRDRLKLGLSEKPPEVGESTTDLAERIRVLKAGVAVEAAPERAVRKPVRAERPVTARIRKRVGEPEREAENPPAPLQAEVIALPEPPDFRRRVRRGDGRQMRMF